MSTHLLIGSCVDATLVAGLVTGEWKPVDWINALIVPLILTFTVGILLAIYTGLIASRIFAFFQARYKAVHWAYALDGVVHKKSLSPRQYHIALSHAVMPIMIEFRALGHEGVVAQLGKLMHTYNRNICATAGVNYDPKFLPDLPDGLTPEEAASFMAAMLQFHNRQMREEIPKLAGAHPSIWALINPIPFPNYMTFEGKLIGLFIARRSWIEVVWLKLKARFRSNDHHTNN